MKLVVIDNNDSFTFNIVEMLRRIKNCKIDVHPSVSTDINEIVKYDKIILSPGPGLPFEFPILSQIINTYHTKKAILGICLGHEALCQFFGAELLNLEKVIHGQPRQINTLNHSVLFKDIPQKFVAGLYHSWVVSERNFPDKLKITALSDDGQIMAIEHKIFKLFGVQFHPESIITEYGDGIMRNFLNA